MFSDVLQKIISSIHCTSKEISEACRLAPSVISRYRSGTRVPAPGSKQLHALAEGLSSLAAERGLKGFQKDDIYRELTSALPADNALPEGHPFAEKLDALLSRMEIRNSDLARVLNFDASFLSKIRKQERRFADPFQSSEKICRYIVRKCDLPSQQALLADLIGNTYAEATDDASRVAALLSWLATDEVPKKELPAERFLQLLDAFDPEQYLRETRYDKLVVPSPVEFPPSSGTYYGTPDRMKAELDFLKMTALSPSEDPVFFYSDMPMQELSQNETFRNQWMFGLGTLLKKGLRFHSIHSVDRPIAEMLPGLSAWIPLYMTGQISPYYLTGVQNNVFLHFLRVSGAVALEGSAIAGHQKDGRYYLTSMPDELENYRLRARHLLSHARPLMQIFREENEFSMRAALGPEDADLPPGTLPFRNIRIRIKKGEWALVSRHSSPVIHFVFRHPKLVRAIEDFTLQDPLSLLPL